MRATVVAAVAALGLVAPGLANESEETMLTTCIDGVEFGPVQPGVRYKRNSGLLGVYRGVAGPDGQALGVDGCVLICANDPECAFVTFVGATGSCKLFPSSSLLKPWDDQQTVSVEKTGQSCDPEERTPEEQPDDPVNPNAPDPSRSTFVSYVPSFNSAMTCQQLGWSKVVGRVCAQSKFPTGYEASGITQECYTGETLEGAAQLCQTLGARLCTKDEALISQVSSQTGCSLDKEWIWTGTACGDGIDGTKYETVHAKKGESACKNPNQPKAVRCCANTDA